MHILESIKISLKMLSRKKMQSFLTMLGIVIGVMAVVIVLSLGESAKEFVLGEVKTIGTDLIAITPGKVGERIPASAFGVVNTSLKCKDGEKLEKMYHPNIDEVAMYVQGNSNIVFEDNALNSSFVGSTESYIIIEKAKIKAGRFFTKEEEQGLARVVVLGSKLAEELFGEQDPIQQKVKIKNMNFRVIGVFEEKGGSMLQDQDKTVVVPIKVAQKLLLGINHINFIRIKVKDESLIDSTIEDVAESLRESHNISSFEDDDFRINTSAEALDTLNIITDALKFFLVAVSFVSLIVGGFGIMNIMLATVEERIQEIGLRKALGAKEGQIVSQFLIETVAITFLSGLIGIILGISISFIAYKVITALNLKWVFLVPIDSIIFATVISITIGLVFGIFPAKKASKLDPIEALRYE